MKNRRIIASNIAAWDKRRRRALKELRIRRDEYVDGLTYKIRHCNDREKRTALYAYQRAIKAQYWSARRRLCETMTVHSVTQVERIKRVRKIKPLQSIASEQP